MKYKNWLCEWLECYVKPSAKRRTYERYSEIARGHIAAALGEVELVEITPLVLQRFVTELSKRGNLRTGEGLSANSVNGIITVMQSSLKCACVAGLLNENAAHKIKRPKIREKEVSCFTVPEQRKIERAAFESKKPKMFGVVLCLYTGLRIGELLALTWDDVDLRNATVSVVKTCYDGKDENGKFTRITGAPKTETSKRIIPVPRQLMSALRKLKRESESDYVIASDGAPVSVRAYQRSFESLLKKLNISRKGFHALRHTFATRAIECGMDVKTLSEILGHKNPTVTLSRYVHSLMEHKKEMMNRLGKSLQAAI